MFVDATQEMLLFHSAIIHGRDDVDGNAKRDCVSREVILYSSCNNSHIWFGLSLIQCVWVCALVYFNAFSFLSQFLDALTQSSCRNVSSAVVMFRDQV